MTKVDRDVFNKMAIQLSKLRDEMSVLSSKKPDEPVNKFKLTLINQVLTDANRILEKKNKPFADFETFDENDLPSNSDVVVILSQYIGCIDKQQTDMYGPFGDIL